MKFMCAHHLELYIQTLLQTTPKFGLPSQKLSCPLGLLGLKSFHRLVILDGAMELIVGRLFYLF